MKSGNLNFLEPSGPLQACNGTALPFAIDLDMTPFLLVSTDFSKDGSGLLVGWQSSVFLDFF